MPSAKLLKTVISEYGFKWLVNRSLYSTKIKSMSAVPVTEGIYEKKTSYPTRTDIFKIDVETLKEFLREKLKQEDKDRLINLADKACKGIIFGFSSIELDYGNPINWQLNPLMGKQCNSKEKWYRIPDFDEDRGDIKVIWEASRFSHFITLSRAYLLTGKEKYYKAFSNQLSDWLRENPYSYGANYKCGQECSLRMVNALLAYTVFRHMGVATDSDSSNIKDLVDRCYRRVLSNFFYAHKCIKNNHTISELMGMIAGAWCCCDDKQLDKAYKWLDEVIDEQFTDDGGYVQFSFNYQRLALQDLECILSMSEVTGRKLSDNSLRKIKASAKLMYQCQDESGDVPNYGSNDGALVFPVTSCGYRDYRPIINSVYALTSGEQLYEKGSFQEELIWFSGGKEIKDFKTNKEKRKSSQFPDAGLFTLRNNNAWAMVVANNYKSRPAHMDQLHFDLWINGINVLCDAGTYSYASSVGRGLIKNCSHNTAEVIGKTQMNMHGPFMILNWTRRNMAKGTDNSFEGVIVSQNGYMHKRIVCSKEAGFKIIDKVSTDAVIHFHTPYAVTVNDNEAIISQDGNTLCRIISETTAEMVDSYRSLYYLRSEKTTDVFFKVRANQDTTIIIKTGEQKND